MEQPTDLDPAERVRAAGLRVTRGRVAVLDFLTRHPHSTAAEVHEGTAKHLPSLSMQSAHNVVNDLTGKAVLRRIDVLGAARYEVNTADNHHHLRCVGCGRIEDVACASGTAPCLHPDPTDLMPVLLSADITFQSLCASCVDAQRANRHHQASRHQQGKGRP